MAEITFSTRGKTIIALVLAAMGVFVVVKVSHVLVPFIWAAVTAYVLNPPVTFLASRARTARAVWALFIYVILGLVGAWMVLALVPVVNQQIGQLVRELPLLVGSAETLFGAKESIDILGVSIQTAALNRQISQSLTDLANAVSRGAFGVLVGVAETLISGIVYLFASFYLLLDGPRLINFLKEQAPARYRSELSGLLIRVNRVLSAFIRGQIILVIIMSTTTYAILTMLQVKYALVLALATGFLELIPFAGPYLAGGISVGVALFQPVVPFGWSNLLLAGIVALAYFILRELEDYLVIPNVIGSLVDLHPLIVIFVVLAGAAFGGITGLFLAVPTAAVLKVVIAFIYPKLVKGEPRERVWVVPADTVESILERIAKTDATRVVLMLTPEAPALVQKEGLRGLRDGARRLRVDLAVSCSSDEACHRAERLGLKTIYDFHVPDSVEVQMGS